MVKKEVGKNSASGGKKVGKIILWILAVVGILFIGLVLYFMFFAGKGTEALNKFNSLESNYLDLSEKFNSEWGLFNPSSQSNTSLQNSLKMDQNLADYVSSMKKNVTDLNTLITQEKAKASGTQLEWWTGVGNCYAKRAEALNNFQDLFNNEPKALIYNYNFILLGQALTELSNLEQQSITYGTLGNKQKDIETLNKMRDKVTEAKAYLKNMKDVGLGFKYLDTYDNFLTFYGTYVDLNLQYYSSPTVEIAKQIYDKYNEIQSISTSISVSSMNEEYDAWSTPNIGNKRDDAVRLNTEADQLCKTASGVYSSAFPNANVVAEVNVTA